MTTSSTIGARRAVGASAILGLVTALLIALPGPATADQILCDGLVPTHLGTAGDDVIIGTDGVDVIHGLDGNDLIYGLDGRDVICGGTGADDLRGGDHGDRIYGGGGNDRIYGGYGYDKLFGGKHDDYMNGGPGNDYMAGKLGNDRVDGRLGADRVIGNEGDDTLVGGPGPDDVFGGDGSDRCAGNTTYNCEGLPYDFKFERFLINQAVPAADSSQAPAERIGTVRDRPGIVRAFISANQPGIPSPTVHLYYRINGDVGLVPMDGPEFLPEIPLESDLTTTFNYVFEDDFLKPGAEMFVLVDRHDVTLEIKEGNNRYPVAGWGDIDTRNVPDLRITVVPVDGVSLSQSQAEALFSKSMRVHPVADHDIFVRAEYECQACSGDLWSDWQTLLNEMLDLQQEEAPNRLYHAIVPESWRQAGLAGIGYIGWPASVSSLGYLADETIAHETGHNLDLLHNVCSGQEGNPDQDFPYEGGSIGGWGYDPVTGATFDPDTWVDLMTYCSPEWVSDFSYGKVLDYRSSAYGYEVVGTGLDTSGSGTVVMFKGTVPAKARAVASFEAVPEGKRINRVPRTEIASAEVVDQAAAPPEPGDNTLVGRDDEGDVVVQVAFRAYAYDHAPAAYFRFSVAISPEDLARITTWEVAKSGKVLTTRDAD